MNIIKKVLWSNRDGRSSTDAPVSTGAQQGSDSVRLSLVSLCTSVQPVLNYISPALKPGLLFYYPFLLHQMSYLVKWENKQQNGSRGGEERILKVVKSDLEKIPMDPL